VFSSKLFTVPGCTNSPRLCWIVDSTPRVHGETVSRIAAKGLLPDVDSRTPATSGEKATEGSGADEVAGASQTSQEGQLALLLCSLVAPGTYDAQEQFTREVEKELTGKDTEPWEIVYFKLHQSQMPVIERAIETASLMLGSNQLFSMTRFFKFLPQSSGRYLSKAWARGRHEPSTALPFRRAAGSDMYHNLRQRVLYGDGWRCQLSGAMSNLEVHHKEFRSQSGNDSEQNLIKLCSNCHSTQWR